MDPVSTVDAASTLVNSVNLAIAICVGLLAIVGAVVKFTKSKKDDEVFEEVEEVVKPVLDALDHKKPKS